jgi:CHAD domain-containing protein
LASGRQNDVVTSQSYVERELKFDVDPGFVVPDVAALLPDGGRVERRSEQLRSDYFDTADHALLRAQMTLRRRTGTADTGWQLKVPQDPFREEIRLSVDHDSVPEELRQLLLGVRRGQPLVQVASVVTEREVARLVSADGRLLAEIDDDTVRASAAGASATVSSWREIEVELGEDEVKLLYALGKRLRRTGARPSASQSKLARALPAAADQPDGARRTSRAGDVLAKYIAEQHRVILAGDLALRRDDDSVIHKTRVATRRLRSTLRSFKPLFDESRASSLDTELRWFAALLGEVRDRQVLQQRLDGMVAQLDDTLTLGPVKARIDTELRTEQAEHWQTLMSEMTGARYLALLTDVAGWVTEPPWTPAARKPATIVARLVRRAERKVSRRLENANATGDIHLLHGARKAAKRARYAAEAAEPVIGRKAGAKQAKRYQKLQDLLGEHQDSLVSADVLRRLGAKAGTVQGENGFAFGVLHEREEQNASAARDKARRIARKYA